jgi:hypothetical protein
LLQSVGLEGALRPHVLVSRVEMLTDADGRPVHRAMVTLQRRRHAATLHRLTQENMLMVDVRPRGGGGGGEGGGPHCTPWLESPRAPVSVPAAHASTPSAPPPHLSHPQGYALPVRSVFPPGALDTDDSDYGGFGDDLPPPLPPIDPRSSATGLDDGSDGAADFGVDAAGGGSAAPGRRSGEGGFAGADAAPVAAGGWIVIGMGGDLRTVVPQRPGGVGERAAARISRYPTGAHFAQPSTMEFDLALQWKELQDLEEVERTALEALQRARRAELLRSQVAHWNGVAGSLASIAKLRGWMCTMREEGFSRQAVEHAVAVAHLSAGAGGGGGGSADFAPAPTAGGPGGSYADMLFGAGSGGDGTAGGGR